MTGTKATAESNGVERTDKQLTERTKAVDAAILTIEKQFGRGSIMKLGSQEKQQVDSIPTGSIALDLPQCGIQCLLAIHLHQPPD